MVELVSNICRCYQRHSRRIGSALHS